MVNDQQRVAAPREFKTFGAWLAAMTDAHGDKARLALAIGAGGQDINGWINGKRPGADKLRAIAKHLDVHYVDLLAFWDPQVREAAATYSAGSSTEPRGVHSVPLRGAISPSNGGIWMDTTMPDELVGVRVVWNESAPELYAYQVLGDELFPRIRAGEYIVVDPREPVKAGEEVLVEANDGRRAVLTFVARNGRMISFQRIGVDQRPVTLAENDIGTMHAITAIVKSGHWTRAPEAP